MKIDARQIDRFLADPGKTRLVLIFGADTSRVVELGRGLAKRVAGSLDDPFRATELSADQAERLAEEASAPAFGGGRRVVLLRDAGDAQVKFAEAALATPGDALMVVLAGDLATRSKLRALVEKRDDCAAIICYVPDASARGPAFAAMLREAGVSITGEALTLAAARLGGETGALRDAAERVILYAGATKRVDAAEIDAVLDDQGTGSMQDAIDATLVGDVAAADHALALALDEGAAPVAVIRVLLGELGRLRLLADKIAQGASPRDAVAAIRPPVFFRRVPLVVQAATRWREAAIIEAITKALAAEAACKSAGAAPDLLCKRLFYDLAGVTARVR
jgi:DNA polymerase-3 subunit delta